MKNADLQVLVFAERWLGVNGPHGNIERIASLGRAVQLAVDQWESDNPIIDTTGRIVKATTPRHLAHWLAALRASCRSPRQGATGQAITPLVHSTCSHILSAPGRAPCDTSAHHAIEPSTGDIAQPSKG